MTFWSIFRYFSNETNTCFPPSSKIQHPHIRLGYEAEQTDKCHGEESFTWSAKQPFFKGTEVWWFPTIYKWMETRFQAVNKTYTEQLQAMASNGSNMRFHTMILWIFDPGDVFFFFFRRGKKTRAVLVRYWDGSAKYVFFFKWKFEICKPLWKWANDLGFWKPCKKRWGFSKRYQRPRPIKGVHSPEKLTAGS